MWAQMNQYEKDHLGQLDKNQQLIGQLESLNLLYNKFRRSNFINEVFYIGTQDQFGTISGFRLGRINNSIEVEWDEINVALGQAVHLMAILAHRFGYKFEKHKINLCGAMSTIQLKFNQPSAQGKSQKFELYYGADEERFNRGLVCLLECLNDLVIEVQKKMSDQLEDTDLKARCYKIDGEEIGGKSIKYRYAESEQWSTAMRYFLMNL